MPAFQFPDPAVTQTVTNPITGSTYQWKANPGKWVVTVSMREIEDIIWEGDSPPDPIGDYKLWYNTDILELNFYYCDANGVCAWVPTSVPITLLEELNAFAVQAEVDINQLQYKQQLLQNTVDLLYLNQETGAGNRPPIFSDTAPLTHPEYTSPDNELIAGDIWYDNTDPDNLEQYIYDGSNWIVYGGQFVKREGGDTMEGPLKVTGDRSVNADGIESTIEVLNVDSGQNSSLNLKHNGATQIYVGSTQTSFQGDVKFNVGGRAIYAGNDKKGFVINNGGVFYDGAYSSDKHVATKKDVEEAIYDDILDTDTNKYVDRAGDSMSGPLVMDDTEVRFNNRSDGDTLIRAGRNEGEFPMLLDLRHPGGSVAGGYDIKIQGNTSYNQLRFVGNDTYLTMNAGGGAPHKVMFNVDISLENNRIQKLGTAVDDTDAVTYGQVKEELEELRDKIVGEVSLGTWKFDTISSTVNPNPGCFITRKDSTAPQISPNDINILRISDEDINGNPGVFDWEIGDLLTFTNTANTTQSIKFRVNGTPANSGTYWVVQVAHITSNYDFFQNAEYYLSHITIDVSVDLDALDDTYLRLDCTNDPLETELEIKTPDFGAAALTLTGKRDNVNNATATITFRNQIDTAEAYVGYLTYRTSGSANGYFKFNQDVDLGNKGLHSVAQIRMQPGGYIGSGSNPRLTFHNATSGNEGEGLLVVPRPSSARRGFAIRGNDATSTEQDILYTYTNATGPDAVNYIGKMDSDNNLVNLGKVKELAETVVLIGTTCNWKKGSLNDTTLDRQYFGIERANSTTSQVGYGSVVYLNKLIAIDGTLQPLKNYTPTDGSLIEVWSGNELWFKSLLDPTTYKVAQRNPNEIVCDMTSYYPIVSKPSTNWSGSTYYKLILTGMKYTG